MSDSNEWDKTNEREIWLSALSNRNIEEEGEDSSKADLPRLM